MAENPYSETTNDAVNSWARIHGNGEQTHVHIVTIADDYAAVALDVDPREYEPVAAELLAFDPTLEGAMERARRWMETHPKGVLGDAAGDGGGGMGSAVVEGLKKLNDYGNNLADQQQQAGNSPGPEGEK